MGQYQQGTVSLTNGSAVVTGSGTLFSSNVSPGQLFFIPSDGIFYQVASVDSHIQLTLAANYAGTTASGISYAVAVDFTPVHSLPEMTAGDLNTASIYTRAMRQIDALIHVPKSYGYGNRPAATSVPVGYMIFNTSSNKPNYSDGTDWRDANGTVV